MGLRKFIYKKTGINFFKKALTYRLDKIKRKLRNFFINHKKVKKNYEKKIINFEKDFDKQLQAISCESIDFSKVSFEQKYSVPSLSWCLQASKGGILITYGSGLYAHSCGIVEGVWDTPFEELQYREAKNIFGSGVTLEKDKIVLTPPSHMYEGIFCLYDKLNKSLYFSNSLTFVFAQSSYWENYIEKFEEEARMKNHEITSSGVFGYNPLLIDCDQYSLYSFYYHNILLSAKELRIETRKNFQYFKNYSEYKNYILSVLKSVIENGESKERSQMLTPISTISQGYDSSAVTCLLRSLDVNETLTLDVDVYGVSDSGEEIAQKLGMKCYSCVHPAGKVIQDLNMEYSGDLTHITDEFVATIGLGDDMVFYAFDEYLDNRIMFTGALGDSVWNFEKELPIGIPVRTRFGKSLSEYRLRKGFCHIPVPTIGAILHESIFQINYEAGMSKFSVGGSYDRPIARRIVEESKIERSLFGNTKNATNPDPLNLLELKQEAFKKQMEKYRE